mgnify:CR=1
MARALEELFVADIYLTSQLHAAALVGQMAEIVFKTLGEVRRRREAYVVGYLRHGLRCGAQQLLGSLQARYAYYLNGRRTCELLHLTVELHATKAEFGGKSLHIEL